MGLNLGGKVVLITGAAMGIGRETALAFAKEGANLALLDIDEKELANTKAVVAKTGVKVSTVVADLSTDKRASQGVRNSLSAFGGDIDVLVNNVVSGAIRTFDELSDDDWSTTFNLNFMSYVRACRAVLPRMRMKGGAIINNASDLARQPEPLSIDYSVSKSAILALTKGLARAEAPKIRVNASSASRGASWQAGGGSSQRHRLPGVRSGEFCHLECLGCGRRQYSEHHLDQHHATIDHDGLAGHVISGS